MFQFKQLHKTFTNRKGYLATNTMVLPKADDETLPYKKMISHCGCFAIV